MKKGTAAITTETGKGEQNQSHKNLAESCASKQKYDKEPAWYEETISNLQKVLRIMTAMRDKTGERELHHRKLGITYYGIGQYEKAIKHLKEGLALAEEIGDKRYEGIAHQNLGVGYEALGQYDRAMSSYQEGLKIAKEIGNKSDAGQAYRNIGACYKSLCSTTKPFYI